MVQHILIGIGDPTQSSQYIGQEYFDQNTQQFYKAAGIAQSDWQLLGAGSGSTSKSIFSASVINGSIEGPGSFDITASNNLYSLGFGGPGLKTVNFPTGLDTSKRHTFIVVGQNTEGGSITVQYGDGSNVSWEGGSAPTFPASGALVETMLFTLDGGIQWYGRVLATF
jgi:hypothetical protein